jgi:site-specific DNA recombinase
MMLSDAERGKFSMVLVAKLDRFMRNTRRLHEWLEYLHGCGVGFTALDYPDLAITTASGGLILAILGAVAEFESRRIGERVTSARVELKKNGRWSAGRPVYGYQWNKKARKFEVVDSEAKVIRLIYDRYLNGNIGIVQIAAELNEAGYRRRPRRNNHRSEAVPAIWHAECVWDVLRTRAYTGQDDHYHYPAIIGADTYDAAQRKLQTARKVLRNPGQWLLQGYSVCGLCGRSLTPKSRRNGRHKYVCLGRHSISHVDGSDYCALPTCHAATLDDVVWKHFSEAASNSDVLRKSIELALAQLEEKQKRLGDASAIENELAELQERKQRIWDNHADGGMPKERMLAQIRQVEAKEKDLQQRLNAVDPAARIETVQLKDFIATARAILDKGDLSVGEFGIDAEVDLQGLLCAGGPDLEPDVIDQQIDKVHDGVRVSVRLSERGMYRLQHADELIMQRRRKLLEMFDVKVVVYPETVEVHGMIPVQTIERANPWSVSKNLGSARCPGWPPTRPTPGARRPWGR